MCEVVGAKDQELHRERAESRKPRGSEMVSLQVLQYQHGVTTGYKKQHLLVSPVMEEKVTVQLSPGSITALPAVTMVRQIAHSHGCG